MAEAMARLRAIAQEEFPVSPLILLGHCMGSFAAQQFVFDHSESIDGLALSGSGALAGLERYRAAGLRNISPGFLSWWPARNAQ